MEKSIIKKEKSDLSPNVDTVNQYGDRPFFANNVENMEYKVFTNQNSDIYDDEGKPYVPLVPTRFDRTRHIIHIGNEDIKLPVELIPLPLIEDYEMPYINALCEVYAEKLEKEITPATLHTLEGRYKRDLAEQRKAFYSAESVQRSVREVLADGEEQFNILKEDAYEGITPVYFDDSYSSGYDRLMAVLSKITNTNLNGSSLTNIFGLINNLEKKGICHILVNDERITSWVNIDE